MQSQTKYTSYHSYNTYSYYLTQSHKIHGTQQTWFTEGKLEDRASNVKKFQFFLLKVKKNSSLSGSHSGL